MQHSPFEIKNRLLRAVDEEYNVVDMGTVLEIVTILEKTPITKEALETTRLGRYINELRRKTKNESLAKRAKDLVRRWRDLILPQAEGGGGVTSVTAEVSAQNGARTTVAPPAGAGGTVASTNASKRNASGSAAVSSMPVSAIPGAASGVPTGAASAYRSHSISPATSLPASDRSLPVSPALSSSRSADAVPRTHASNKRLRKEGQPSSLSASPELPPAKKPKTQTDGPADEPAPIARQNGDHYEPEDVGSDVEIVSVTPAKQKKEKKAPKDRTKKKKKDKGGNRDIVKENIASIARLHKVKTTEELLAGLKQPRGSDNCGLPSEDVEKNKSEHIVKYLKSQSENDEDALVDVEGRSDVEEEAKSVQPAVKSVKIKKSKNKEKKSFSVSLSSAGASGGASAPKSTFATPEEILARLPPLDISSIDWTVDETPDDETVAFKTTTDVTDADVDRILNQHVEGLNGNFEQLEPGGERVFREWHEVYTATSSGTPLHILPYVVID